MAGADWTAAILRSSRCHRLLVSRSAWSVKGPEGRVLSEGNEGGQWSGANRMSSLEEYLCEAVRIGRYSSAKEKEGKGVWCDPDSPARLPEWLKICK